MQRRRDRRPFLDTHCSHFKTPAHGPLPWSLRTVCSRPFLIVKLYGHTGKLGTKGKDPIVIEGVELEWHPGPGAFSLKIIFTDNPNALMWWNGRERITMKRQRRRRWKALEGKIEEERSRNRKAKEAVRGRNEPYLLARSDCRPIPEEAPARLLWRSMAGRWLAECHRILSQEAVRLTL